MSPSGAGYDDIARSLQALAARYVRELSDYAVVERAYGAGAEGVLLHPVRPDAAAVGWTDLGRTVAVHIGDRRPVLLPRRPETVEDLRLLCDAVVAGRGHQLRGLLRTRVVFDLADGRTGSLPARKGRAIARCPVIQAHRNRRPTAKTYAPYR